MLGQCFDTQVCLKLPSAIPASIRFSNWFVDVLSTSLSTAWSLILRRVGYRTRHSVQTPWNRQEMTPLLQRNARVLSTSNGEGPVDREPDLTSHPGELLLHLLLVTGFSIVQTMAEGG